MVLHAPAGRNFIDIVRDHLAYSTKNKLLHDAGCATITTKYLERCLHRKSGNQCPCNLLVVKHEGERYETDDGIKIYVDGWMF